LESFYEQSLHQQICHWTGSAYVPVAKMGSDGLQSGEYDPDLVEKITKDPQKLSVRPIRASGRIQLEDDAGRSKSV
jgi:hypothetical protein